MPLALSMNLFATKSTINTMLLEVVTAINSFFSPLTIHNYNNKKGNGERMRNNG